MNYSRVRRRTRRPLEVREGFDGPAVEPAALLLGAKGKNTRGGEITDLGLKRMGFQRLASSELSCCTTGRSFGTSGWRRIGWGRRRS